MEHGSQFHNFQKKLTIEILYLLWKNVLKQKIFANNRSRGRRGLYFNKVPSSKYFASIVNLIIFFEFVSNFFIIVTRYA